MSHRDLSLATIITPLSLRYPPFVAVIPLYSLLCVIHSSSNLQYQQAAHVMTTTTTTAAFGTRHTGRDQNSDNRMGWRGRDGPQTVPVAYKGHRLRNGLSKQSRSIGYRYLMLK